MDRDVMMALLAGKITPIIVDEAGDFEGDDGMRVTVLPNHVLFEVASGPVNGHILVDITDLFTAIMKMTQEAGN